MYCVIIFLRVVITGVYMLFNAIYCYLNAIYCYLNAIYCYLYAIFSVCVACTAPHLSCSGICYGDMYPKSLKCIWNTQEWGKLIYSTRVIMRCLSTSGDGNKILSPLKKSNSHGNCILRACALMTNAIQAFNGGFITVKHFLSILY